MMPMSIAGIMPNPKNINAMHMEQITTAEINLFFRVHFMDAHSAFRCLCSPPSFRGSSVFEQPPKTSYSVRSGAYDRCP